MQAAKVARAKSLETINAKLVAAIDGLIATRATESDLETVKALVDEKKKFISDDQLPSLPILEDATNEYIIGRKQCASQMYQEYQRIIGSCRSQKLVLEANAAEREIKEFVAREQRVLDRKTVVTVAKKTKSTAELIADYARFYDDYCRDIVSQETSARAQALANEFSTQANAHLKGQGWTLHCPILEIEDLGRDVYAITVSRPIEMTEGALNFSCRTDFSLQLTKAVALGTKPGDILVVSGTPECTMQSDRTKVVLTPRKGAVRDQYRDFLRGNALEFSTAKCVVRPAETAEEKQAAENAPKSTLGTTNGFEIDGGSSGFFGGGLRN